MLCARTPTSRGLRRFQATADPNSVRAARLDPNDLLDPGHASHAEEPQVREVAPGHFVACHFPAAANV